MVDLGFFAMPLHPKERDYREVMEENRAQILLADKLGLTEAWIGEHQTSISEPITDPFLFMATTIHETKNIKFGSAVLNLSYHHSGKTRDADRDVRPDQRRADTGRHWSGRPSERFRDFRRRPRALL